MMLFDNYNIALIAIAYIGCVSILAFLSFARDKHCAIRGDWRISEGTLLLLALAGGSIGSITGQYLLRHKTRKQPFKFYLHSIAVLQLVLLVTLSFEEGRYFMGHLVELL